MQPAGRSPGSGWHGAGGSGGIVAILAGLAVIAGVIVAVAGGGGGDGGSAAAAPAGAEAGRGRTGRRAGRTRATAGWRARVPLAERPSDLVFSGGSAWALLGSMQRLAEIDVARRRQVGSVALPFVPGGVAAAGDSVFVTEEGGPGLVRIDAATRKIADRWTVDTHGPAHVQPDRHRGRGGIGLGGERRRGGARERRHRARAAPLRAAGDRHAGHVRRRRTSGPRAARTAWWRRSIQSSTRSPPARRCTAGSTR